MSNTTLEQKVPVKTQITGQTCYNLYLCKTNAYVDLNHQKYCSRCDGTGVCISGVPELYYLPIVRFEIPLNPMRFIIK